MYVSLLFRLPLYESEHELTLTATQFVVRMTDNWYEATVTAEHPYRIMSIVDWVADAPAPDVQVRVRTRSKGSCARRPASSPDAPPQPPRAASGSSTHYPGSSPDLSSHSDRDQAPISPPPPHQIPIPHAPLPPHLPSIGLYRVFPWGTNDPSLGPRFLVPEKPDLVASPLGWHTFTRPQSGLEDTTAGNNVFAQENWSGGGESKGNYRPKGVYRVGEGVIFDFGYEPKKSVDGEPMDMKNEARRYVNASVTQLFYTANMVHDLYYRYVYSVSLLRIHHHHPCGLWH